MDADSSTKNIDRRLDELTGLESRLKEIDRERIRLLDRISGLRSNGDRRPSAGSVEPATVTRDSPPNEKVALFASLFRSRPDVYAVRWENSRAGRSGFQPACANEWVRDLCDKKRTRCSACANREFLPLDAEVLRDHLRGRRGVVGDREFVAGVYPLLHDETCWFVAIDLDGAGWQEDARSLIGVCEELGVPGALERSRSGNGAHLWVFFSEAVPAVLARKLASLLLTRAMESRPEIGLGSYDRLFPSQDTMPHGGFGNLIALPLQRAARDQQNSVFVDRGFVPYDDQFAFLSGLGRLSPQRAERLVDQAESAGRLMGVRVVPDDDRPDEPWRQARVFGGLCEGDEQQLLIGLPESLPVILANQIYIPREGLSPALRNRIIRMAAFQNPEFYRAQAMHLPVHGHARVIGCAEDFPKHLALPRGCLKELEALLAELGVCVEIDDQRFAGVPISPAFTGILRAEQQDAARAILAHDTGVLSAGTAFGKTVVAAYAIAARKVNTLILVHRQQLLDQWKARLATFLDIDQKEIGEIRGGKRKPSGIIDVALLQSLGRGGRVSEIVAEYGQLIFDECHHLPAGTFEQVARAAAARYVLGLSATPTRKDGHHPILFMQCGPIRHRVDLRRQAAARPFSHRVIVRPTEFGSRPPALSNDAAAGQPHPGIQELYAALAADTARNEIIVQDVLTAVETGRSPVVLTERREHLETLSNAIRSQVAHVVVLHGGMGAKRRREIAQQLLGIPPEEARVLVATGRYLGEGFDDSRLDTLFLALPISWRGTLAQYAGRLHRLAEGKTEVVIYDYADLRVPMLARMHQRRLLGYRAMGYQMD
jgi:superfamily II DNA or RNA helicase